MNIKMFGHIKNLLRKWVETPDEDQPALALGATPALRRNIVMAPCPEGRRRTRMVFITTAEGSSFPCNRSQRAPAGIAAAAPAGGCRRPDHFHSARKDPGATLTRSGADFLGELRQAAPHLFTPEDDRDRVLVPLPLGECLTRLNPALITRRRVQRQVEIPADICSPFDQRSQGLIFSVGPANPASAPTPAPAPPLRHAATPALTPVVPPARSGMTFAPTPPPPTAVPHSAPAMSSAARVLRELSSS